MNNREKHVFFTIGIPTHEMKGEGFRHLNFLLNKLDKQIEKNFELIISDHSENDDIKKVVYKWASKLNIRYYRKVNDKTNVCSNINNIISKSNGRYIKFFFLDDYPKRDDCLQVFKRQIIKENYPKWILCGSDHSRDSIEYHNSIIPIYNNKIHLGKNTISSPSVLCIENKEPILFDENFKWLLDVVYYKDCFKKFGSPSIIKQILVTNGEGSNRLHDSINLKNKYNDIFKSIRKYHKGFPRLLYTFKYKLRYFAHKTLNQKT